MMLNPGYFVGKKPNGNLLARGRSYSPIDDMVEAIPPGTPITPDAITAELHAMRIWNLALIAASLDFILARIDADDREKIGWTEALR